MHPPTPTPDHLRQAAALWALLDMPAPLRQVENFVYTVPSLAGPRILRLTAATRRTPAELAAELDWMRHLAEAGVQVAAPVPSARGRLVETLASQEGTFHAAVFAFAPGRPLRNADDFTPEIHRAWGAFLGRLHHATQTYVPGPTIVQRDHWRDEVGLLLARTALDPADRLPWQRFHQLHEWLDGLDRGPDVYGLVHGDLHHGNFHVDAGRITAFDFDDCCQHWRVYDLASPLFSVFFRWHTDGFPQRRDDFVSDLLAGYRTETPLAPEWEQRLPGFFAWRTVLLYHWVKARLAQGTLDAGWAAQALPWCLQQLERLPALA